MAWASSLRLWFRCPYALLTASLALVFGPALGLVSLGWRLLDQDRALESQRIEERRENAADQAIAALQRLLQTAYDVHAEEVAAWLGMDRSAEASSLALAEAGAWNRALWSIGSGISTREL